MGGGALSNIFKKIFANTADDVANKVASQYSDDVIRNLAASSADDIAAKQGNLIATHQLTADKLKGAAELGGFVQPSMAVVDANKATNFLPAGDFGDIVMVANRNTINPANKAMKTVIGDRDIYSPRFPDTSYKINEDVLKDVLKDYPTISKASVMSNLDLNNTPVDDTVMSMMFKYDNPQYDKVSKWEMRDNPDYQAFADDMFGKLKGDKYIDYETRSGNWRTMPLTAENANKAMNMNSAVGGERGYNVPSTIAYHQNTKKMKTLDDLYKNRYRMIDSETGRETENAMRSAVASAVNDIRMQGDVQFPE